ncbi:hypothetical protein Glove_467g8 [Diversispora epigaea]|uniref:Uncharacterized protein n=1 Tax=Diversispora epigaea TaxID=1348612 RepID=A0A397GR12_9GLOM|nr:hypothetical protein Glove_467g8 [Diversispora epigaea]
MKKNHIQNSNNNNNNSNNNNNNNNNKNKNNNNNIISRKTKVIVVDVQFTLYSFILLIPVIQFSNFLYWCVMCGFVYSSKNLKTFFLLRYLIM